VARGVLPFVLGATIAWSQGNPINWAVLGLSVLGVVFIMLMTFMVNDYYDYDADVINKTFHRFSGGSRVLPSEVIPKQHALIGGWILLLLAVPIGLVLQLYYHTGPWTIPLGALAAFIGYFYTAKPFQWSYHGLGEIAIWFSCGWLATITGYYLQVGHFDTVTTLVSIPGATSIFLVILINELPDIPSDKLAGKRNLAVMLGMERSLILYSILLIVCYINIVVIIPFGAPMLSGLLSLILLPLIFWNILTLRRRLMDKNALEGLSLRTMIIDHLITFIYLIAFVVQGAGWFV
jgi:1,4-dihydroxy-2-naphthoate octaprenyltransferase